MFSIDALFVVFFCLATLVLLIIKRSSLSCIPHYRALLSMFAAFFVGSFVSIFEEVPLLIVFDHIEHISYFLACLFLMVWCHSILKSGH